MSEWVERPEFGRFLMMAIGSADEMQVWTMYCRDLGYIGSEVAERWQGETGRSPGCSGACVAAVLITDF